MDKAEELMNLPESLKQEAVELLNDVYVKKIPVELIGNKVHLWKELVEDFKVNFHFESAISHKEFILKVWNRFNFCFSHLSKDQVECHDQSKLQSFTEIIGYTEKWVWLKHTPIWEMALNHHYQNNPHHPEHFQDTDQMGQKTSKNMPIEYLEESIVDMLACRWERKLGGNPNVTNEELCNIEEIYLKRYTHHDKMMVIEILNKIKASPSLNIDFYELEVFSEKMYHRQISLDNSVPEALTWEDLEIHEDQENFVELDNALSAIKICE